MIITKKHIAAVIMVIFSAGIAFGGIKKYASIQTFSGNNLKIVVDAGHGGCRKCFKQDFGVTAVVCNYTDKKKENYKGY